MESPTGLANLLNEKLSVATRRRTYAAVSVLILYWEDDKEGFRDEGRELGNVFRQTLQYNVQEFGIPSSESQLCLSHFLTGAIIGLKNKHQMPGDNSLLIIHYGGHGDQDDNKINGEERRSVWAAHASGPPTLQWYRIQEDIRNSGIDTLLLLDCCFAAQAGRAHEDIPSNFEFLAAAAMGMKTPLPGSRSFTHALMRRIEEEVKHNGYARVIDLHKQLLHRDAELYATPIHASLGSGLKPIVLQPLSLLMVPIPIHKDDDLFFQFTFTTSETLTKSFINRIAQWLGESAPRGITAPKIQDILQNTSQIQNFVATSMCSSQALAQALEAPALQDIIQAWERLSGLITAYNLAQRNKTQGGAVEEVLRQRLLDFIQTLEVENAGFSEILEYHVLNSGRIKDPLFLDEVIRDPMSTELGIVDQLQLRQMVNLSEQHVSRGYDSIDKSDDSLGILHEYKSYSPYLDPSELPDLEHRVSLLYRLLGKEKSSKFLSLRCRNWTNEKIRNRFIFEFEVPSKYHAEPESTSTLYTVIYPKKSIDRPSLNERLNMAYMLARAIQSWHSVGWLHQGISSHSILFLTIVGEKRPDYSHPLLQGFQFTRPKDDPSIGRPRDDVGLSIYRHPERQGGGRKGHTKLHDIYSLGVVLLEIGIWQRAIDILQIKDGKPSPSPSTAKAMFITACETRLDHYAGTAYGTAVRNCLTSSFDISLDDQNDTHLAIAFQDRVIRHLVAGVNLS